MIVNGIKKVCISAVSDHDFADCIWIDNAIDGGEFISERSTVRDLNNNEYSLYQAYSFEFSHLDSHLFDAINNFSTNNTEVHVYVFTISGNLFFHDEIRLKTSLNSNLTVGTVFSQKIRFSFASQEITANIGDNLLYSDVASGNYQTSSWFWNKTGVTTFVVDSGRYHLVNSANPATSILKRQRDKIPCREGDRIGVTATVEKPPVDISDTGVFGVILKYYNDIGGDVGQSVVANATVGVSTVQGVVTIPSGTTYFLAGMISTYSTIPIDLYMDNIQINCDIAKQYQGV